MKRVIAVFMAFIMAIGLAGCEASSGSSAGASKTASAPASGSTAASVVSSTKASDDVTIGYYGIDTTQAFFKDVYDGLDKACKERGWTLNAEFTNYDPVKMKAAYNDFKSQKVDFIIDGNAMQDISKPFAEQAATDDIPYLGLHETLPEPAYTYGTANSDMGAAVGEYIGKMVKDEWGGNVDLIVLVGTFTSGPEITERLTSAVPALGKYVDNIDSVNVLKIDADSGDTQAVYQQVMDAMTANPNAKHIAMFCQTDDMANSAFSAVTAAGRADNVMGTGSDCSAVATDYFKEAIDSGNTKVPWRGSIYLGAINYGEALCDLVQKVLDGEKVPYTTTFIPDVVGVTNLYDILPDLKNK